MTPIGSRTPCSPCPPTMSSWVREPEDWEPRSHNVYRQFHSLVRHLIARYDVPTFMNTAWLEGLTARSVVHQRWFIHVAQGQNIRTADGLPIPLTKKQAHLYLQAPDDFDVLGAFRWAQIIDLGGTERLVRSVLTTRIRAEFDHDEFWATVFRWLIANPMLDPAQHGPIIDYLHDQRFVASVPNPAAHLPGQPRLVPPQPNLTMKGRNPVTLLRSVADWHRQLGRERTKKAILLGAQRDRALPLRGGKGRGLEGLYDRRAPLIPRVAGRGPGDEPLREHLRGFLRLRSGLDLDAEGRRCRRQ